MYTCSGQPISFEISYYIFYNLFIFFMIYLQLIQKRLSLGNLKSKLQNTRKSMSRHARLGFYSP